MPKKEYMTNTSLRSCVVRWASAACGVAGVMLAGCVTEKENRPNVGPPPNKPIPTTMFMSAQPPRDTNSNGYLDSCVVTIYLFQNPYPRSVRAAGEFSFRMVGKGGTLIREWKLADPGPEIAEVMAGVGPGYVARLSLIDGKGSDALAAQSVDLYGAFTDAAGNTVQATPTAVLVGRITQ